MNKRNEDSFSSYHPLINFIYFLSVIMFSMFFMHPVFLIISLIGSMVYSFYLKGISAVKFNILYMLLVLLFIAIINPLVSHEGVTALVYVNNNPITLEAIVFGIASGIMFISVLVFFSSYNLIMTSDKFMYLFGKVMPSISLIISMVLRFVPRFKKQINVIAQGQKSIGKDTSDGNLFDRASHGVHIVSILTTWALENSIETADSMKARGYGLKGRTNFFPYKFRKRDKILLVAMMALISIVMIGAILGENTIYYYPKIIMNAITYRSVIIYTAYGLLCILPVIVDVMEEIRWKLLK